MRFRRRPAHGHRPDAGPLPARRARRGVPAQADPPQFHHHGRPRPYPARALDVHWTCTRRALGFPDHRGMRTMRIRSGRRGWLWLALSVPAVVAAALTGWALRPGPAPAPQARQYLDVSACLLTGPRGVTPGAPAAPTWAAMEKASLTTHVMVSYL